MFVVRHSSLDGGQKFQVTGNAREAVEVVKAGKADLIAIDGRAELEHRTSKFVGRLVAEGQPSKKEKE